MMHTDVAIVGGGLAGSLTAAMIGRMGHRAVLVDPHERYPADFRCEKLDAGQLAILRETGLAEPVVSGTCPDEEVWIGRHGRIVERRRTRHVGLLYPDIVNRVRAAIPPGIAVIEAKATAVSTGPDRQAVTLSNGDAVSARLVVLANGLNHGLRRSMGLQHREISPHHSISVGFDLAPAGGGAFPFPSLTYYPERARERISYLTLFPVGAGMRANLFAYWDIRDPRLRALRDRTAETLAALLPELRRWTGPYAAGGPVQVRPIDLYVTEGHLRPGLVLVGDAFGTSCPTAGTGVNKVFTDVERLCNHHLAGWLVTEGMGMDKIAAFYADPIKQACDRHSAARAAQARRLATEPGLRWQAWRWVRRTGQTGLAALRRAGPADAPTLTRAH